MAAAWTLIWTCTSNASTMWLLVLPGHDIPFQKPLDMLNISVGGFLNFVDITLVTLGNKPRVS